MENGLKIACAGEAMVELSLDGTGASLGFAGDTFNTAVYLRRTMGEEHEVSFVSRVGVDVLSNRLAAFIEAEGVSTDHLERHETRLPGLYAISTDDAGERSFLYWRENSAARLMFQGDMGLDFSSLDGFDVIYVSAISLAILPPEVRDGFFSYIAKFRQNGGRFAFDSNWRPRLWESVEVARKVVEQAWRLSDIAMPSVDDEMDLFGDADSDAVLERLRRFKVGAGALKRGAEGPVSIWPQDLEPPEFKPASSVVDTTAAGDSFNGGFLGRYLIDGNLNAAMLAGHELASKVVGCRGAIIPRVLT